MATRRNANRIRGPQSALTDFLAANNISAQQIRDDYQRRRAQAEADAAANEPVQDDQAAADEAEEAEAAIERSRKRRKVQQEAISKIKKGKGKGKGKKKKRGSDGEDESDSEFEGDMLGRDMYKKAAKLPGQLENCELCDKRFTVTPYSKNGPDGGLLCTPCGKELAKDAKVENKPKKGPAGKKRRKVESDRLDGRIQLGAKTLQQLCIEKVAHHATDVDDLGDLPENLMQRLGEIFTKQRVMKPKALRLFLRPDLNTITIHDCAYLDTDDFKQIFAVVPHVERLVLGNACQFKNEAMEYMTEKAEHINFLQLYAANLISDQAWTSFFRERGQNLEGLKLQWLDAAFEDAQVEDIARYCSNLKRLKLKRCRRLTSTALKHIAQLRNLEHLSLQLSVSVPNVDLVELIEAVGSNLLTLSLTSFSDVDDSVLEAICLNCQNIRKFRINDNDTMSDLGLASLFTSWANPPLRYVDLSVTRDVDNSNPDGPEDVVGLGPASFLALMEHSGSKLEYLNMSSCRHVSFDVLTNVFDGAKQYPELKEVDLSFVSGVDTLVLAGLFKCAPALRKVVAFGCFNIEDVVVPQGVVVIGVPRAQDAIERFGVAGLDVEGAMESMAEMFAGDAIEGAVGESMEIDS